MPRLPLSLPPPLLPPTPAARAPPPARTTAGNGRAHVHVTVWVAAALLPSAAAARTRALPPLDHAPPPREASRAGGCLMLWVPLVNHTEWLLGAGHVGGGTRIGGAEADGLRRVRAAGVRAPRPLLERPLLPTSVRAADDVGTTGIAGETEAKRKTRGEAAAEVVG